MLQNILSIVIALGVLITFHEFGHYYIARLCGVKVLRFSVGFGKPIYRHVSRSGTEFTLAMIPLGGYVRMLDEREGNVPDALKGQTFNCKTVWQRIAIVAAGPIANFILAIAIYAVVAGMGIQAIAPKVAGVAENSPLSQTQIESGAEITQLNGVPTHSWEDVNLALADLIGRTGTYTVRYQFLDTNLEREERFTLNRWLAGEEPSNLISEFGVVPWRPQVVPTISEVVTGGAAEEAGFLKGDTVTAINTEPVSDWQSFVSWVQKSPDTVLDVVVDRSGQKIDLSLVPDAREVNGTVMGFAGLAVEPPVLSDDDIRTREFGFLGAAVYGVQQTWKMTALTVSSIGKMIQGLISLDNLSGPITIAKVASASADSGVQSFLKFLAYLSVSLGVLNLLPIPMLDGGHLLFFGIEAVRRKPVSERIQGFAYRFGASLLFAMMAVALFNDIARL
ncbi:Regulator of sigma-E protease RseP [Marinomonas gallaica]|uniref:Zinc metalloprotease n=1 Tax=Marinomonas gallaica TaxID=1806667 RepID=A0A1C3JMT3_9GAMM|nr:RIP metalloprotease RseP [Marinomonas gallaica]SBT16465.1 Regulator of sigma-E protease RseP [Marinomonas gallaica]SBT20181.1 Regulator of sigma-E protease RseP [Marinomonas gallaica]